MSMIEPFENNNDAYERGYLAGLGDRNALVAERDALQRRVDHAATQRAVPSVERYRASLRLDTAIVEEINRRGPNRTLADDAYIAGMRAAFRIVQAS